MNSERELTPAEKRWWNRLRKCLAEMPDTVEILVHHGSISIADSNARELYFAKHGHVDNIPTITHATVRRVYPNGESL